MPASGPSAGPSWLARSSTTPVVCGPDQLTGRPRLAVVASRRAGPVHPRRGGAVPVQLRRDAGHRQLGRARPVVATPAAVIAAVVARALLGRLVQHNADDAGVHLG